MRDELVSLQQRHRSRDEEIAELELSGAADQLTIKRLKKEKLALKDRIRTVEDRSEERRGGKVWSRRWSADAEKSIGGV